MWTTLFWLTNAIALVGWLLLLFAPRKPLTNSAVLYLGVALLCLCYVAIFIGLFGSLIDPVRVAGVAALGPFEYSISGLRDLFFLSDGGVVLGWTHYLAFDLFVGTWIARDADHKAVGRLMQAPFLIATFYAGPIGLLFWLIFRERRARLTGRG